MDEKRYALPIVYVRGYAGTQSEVDLTVDDPFYGFNVGSTHIRQDQTGKPEMYFFESPLVRLISDYNYTEVFNGYTQAIIKDRCNDPLRTLWIHRYYDRTARTFDNPDWARLTIEEAAKDLADFIENVQSQVSNWYGNGAQKTKVNLLAHSMGGLVCRSLIQKVYPEQGKKASDYIDKFFTFGTPHGGIHFDMPGGGGIERLRDTLGINGSDTFGRKRMYEFLTPYASPNGAPDDFDPQFMDKRDLDPDRVFCIVGTNARDYDVMYGLSRTAVGENSDGLVQTDSAFVRGAHQAFIHRSHSGRYGMVNSEEAYQNLERFFFGSHKCKAFLCDCELDYSTRTGIAPVYYVETRVAIRNLPVAMHERSLEHLSAMTIDEHKAREFAGSIPIFTTFLDQSKARGGSMMFVMRIAIHKEEREKGLLPWHNNVSRLPIWSDYLIIEIKPMQEDRSVLSPSFRWNSEGGMQDNPKPMLAFDDKGTKIRADNLAKAQQTLREIRYDASLPDVSTRGMFGANAVIRVFASDWGTK